MTHPNIGGFWRGFWRWYPQIIENYRLHFGTETHKVLGWINWSNSLTSKVRPFGDSYPNPITIPIFPATSCHVRLQPCTVILPSLSQLSPLVFLSCPPVSSNVEIREIPYDMLSIEVWIPGVGPASTLLRIRLPSRSTSFFPENQVTDDHHD